MIENISNPLINPTFEQDRKSGLSAFLRVKNGEDFLVPTILSIIDSVDEIVCVANCCADSTLSLLCYVQSLSPDKIKIFNYLPEVFGPGTQGFLNSPENSPHNLAYYYNFALSKTSYKYVFKLDDDELFFKNIIDINYKKILTKKNNCIGLRGVNVIDINKKLYVNKNYMFTGGFDTLLFRYENGCFFKKGPRCEIFNYSEKPLEIVTCFYHTKFCKKDRGFNNYNIMNEHNPYKNTNQSFFTSCGVKDNLLSLDIIMKQLNIKDSPFDLGFEYINDSVKQYNYPLFETLEKQLFNVEKSFRQN